MNEICPWDTNFQDLNFQSKQMIKNNGQFNALIDKNKQCFQNQKTITLSNKKLSNQKIKYQRPFSSTSKTLEKPTTKFDLQLQILKLQSQQIPLDKRSSEKMCRHHKISINQKQFTINQRLKANGSIKMLSSYKSMQRSTSRLISNKRYIKKSIIGNKTNSTKQGNLRKLIQPMIIRLGNKNEQQKIVQKKVKYKQQFEQNCQKKKKKI